MASNNKHIYSSTECYLSPLAKQAIDELMIQGMDKDLAINLLEQVWPESAIYDLGEES